MARYEHLPIYKKAMEIAVYFEKAVAGFSRYNKYTLGADLRNKSREIVTLIARANSSQNKLPLLHELRERLEEIMILIRIGKEVRAFKSFKSFQFALEGVVSVSRQNEGWLRSMDRKEKGPELCGTGSSSGLHERAEFNHCASVPLAGLTSMIMQDGIPDEGFPFMFSFENIYRQYLLCRRNKRNTINALRFEVRHEKNLLDLKEALETRTYQPSRSVCFFATKPKLREIFAADFRDRVVHHILVDYLEKIWEPVFIHDSYVCRKGKGIHQAALRLQGYIRQVTGNGTSPAYLA